MVCQTDVINHMLQKPILSNRIGKWAYALDEYDLGCAPLRSMRGQIIADFIVEHRINDEHDLEVVYITCTTWKLFFDGRLVMMVKELVLSLSLRLAQFLNSQTDWKKNA